MERHIIRDVINEIAFMLFSVFILCTPFFEKGVSSWLLFPCGLAFLMALVVTYTVGFRFDNQFKDVFLSDKSIDSKLPLAFISAKWLVSLRLIRAGMYARNIVFPKGATKNWIQESWFHGYNFRKHARWFDILASYLLFITIGLLIISGISLFVYQVINKQYS